MSMSISEMYQEMIDQYTEMYMSKGTQRDQGCRCHEDILDDMSAHRGDLNIRMRPSGRIRDLVAILVPVFPIIENT